MSDVIQFPDRKDAPYINREAIEAACVALEQEIGAIVIASQEELGVIDPIAYELNAHLVAIRRAMASVPDDDENAS